MAYYKKLNQKLTEENILFFQRVKRVQAIVDTQPPNLAAETFLRFGKFHEDLNRLKELINENLKLLQRLNYIHRTHGVVDNFNPLAELNVSRLQHHCRNLKQYEKENILLSKRLSNVKSIVPKSVELEKDWQQKLSEIISKAKYPIVLPFLTEKSKRKIEYRRLFLDIGFENGLSLGQLTILLFVAYVPLLAQIFLNLCCDIKNNTEIGDGKKIGHLPFLVGTSMYKIYSGLYSEGIYSGDERICSGEEENDIDNNIIDQDEDGVIAILPISSHAIGIRIGFRSLSIFKRKFIAIGKIINGSEVLKEIQSYGTNNGIPKKKIIIQNCGILN